MEGRSARSVCLLVLRGGKGREGEEERGRDGKGRGGEREGKKEREGRRNGPSAATGHMPVENG